MAVTNWPSSLSVFPAQMTATSRNHSGVFPPAGSSGTEQMAKSRGEILRGLGLRLWRFSFACQSQRFTHELIAQPEIHGLQSRERLR